MQEELFKQLKKEIRKELLQELETLATKAKQYAESQAIAWNKNNNEEDPIYKSYTKDFNACDLFYTKWETRANTYKEILKDLKALKEE